jgi:hypothetical protein
MKGRPLLHRTNCIKCGSPLNGKSLVYCLSCRRILSSVYKQNNIEEIREKDRRRKKIFRATHKGYKTEEYREYCRKNPEKVKAQQKLNSAIRYKKIKKEPCMFCGKKFVHGHHEDYNKPLEVDWMCPPCHYKYHLLKSRSCSNLNK